jgi:hypothetical protein
MATDGFLGVTERLDIDMITCQLPNTSVFEHLIRFVLPINRL